MNLLDSALKILALRPHSRQEIISFLHRKTQDEDLINQTIQKLEKARLIDDAAFARWLVESRSRSRPRGSRLLTQELKQKGIDLPVKVDEVELAQKALDKKRSKSRDQAIRFLQYRGFSWDAIAKVVKTRYN